MWTRLMLHIHVIVIVARLKGERDITGIMRQTLKWQSACQIPEPAVLHVITHSGPHGCCWNMHTAGVSLCVCVFVSGCVVRDHVYVRVQRLDESLCSTPIGSRLCCEDEYVLPGQPWGEIPLSGATLELTHFLSLCPSLGRDVSHKRPAAHTGRIVCFYAAFSYFCAFASLSHSHSSFQS